MRDSQLNLKDIFALIAFCAVSVWALTAGFNAMVVIVVPISAIVAFAWVILARDPRLRFASVAISFMWLAAGVCFLSTYAVSQASVLALFSFVVYGSKSPITQRGITYIGFLSVAIGMFTAGLWGRIKVESLKETRRLYPLVQIDERLDYERKSSSMRSIPFAMSKKSDDRLTQFDYDLQKLDNHQRVTDLKYLHDRAYQRFIAADGFGFNRMYRPNMRTLRIPPITNIPFASVAGTSTRSTDAGEFLSRWRSSYGFDADHNSPEDLHQALKLDFVDPLGYGMIVKPRKSLIAFVEHAIHASPNAVINSDQDQAIGIEKVELVSLLKFDVPKVYVLDHMPRMDELRLPNVKTRDLDEFERTALARLLVDEDIVITNDSNNTRMLGSLRAGTQCLECHNTNRGVLLGAFSYFLKVSPPQ